MMSDSRAARFIGRPATLTPWLCISRARAETYHSCPPKTYWWPGARSTSVPSKFHSCGLTEWGSSEPPAFRSMPDRSMCSSIHSLWMMHRAALQSRDDFGDEQRPVAQQVRLYAAVPVAVHKRPRCGRQSNTPATRVATCPGMKFAANALERPFGAYLVRQ